MWMTGQNHILVLFFDEIILKMNHNLGIFNIGYV